MKIGLFSLSPCVARCGSLPPLVASEGQEKGNVHSTTTRTHDGVAGVGEQPPPVCRPSREETGDVALARSAGFVAVDREQSVDGHATTQPTFIGPSSSRRRWRHSRAPQPPPTEPVCPLPPSPHRRRCGSRSPLPLGSRRSTSFPASGRARFGSFLERGQRRAPEVVELREPFVMHSREAQHGEPVALLATNAGRRHEPGLSKHPQVTRDSRAAHVRETVGNLSSQALLTRS